jgi:predicted RND superfamily exporter protein
LSKFNEKNEKLSAALSNVALPVILAAITTMAGFIAFVFSSYFHMIRDFGIFSTLGIFFTLLLSLFFTPAVLSYLPPLKKPRGREKEILKHLALVISRHSVLILACGLLLVLVSLFYISRVEREVDIISYFKSDTEIRMAEDLMKDKFGGSTTIQILAAGDMQEPGVIRKMKNMENFIEGHEHIHNVHSIVEIIEQMNWIIDDSKKIPDSRKKIANLWFLLEGEEAIEQLVNQDKSEAVIRATLGNQNSKDIADIVHSIENYLVENKSAEIEFQLCGSASVYYRVDSAIKHSQRQSLLIAIALIFLVNIFLLGSLRGALIGLIPIAFTLVILFGFMGLTRIPLDVATVLIGSISLGIGIDYSIHFINRYREELAISGNGEEALAVTLSTTGRAIATNVATVSLGFITLLFGNFIPLQRFGLLIVVTMISSGTAALTLLPAALFLMPLQPNKESNPGNNKHKN